MKKLFILFLIGIFLIPVSFATMNFSDVSDSTHYKDSIEWMQENGVIQGYEDGTFKPEKCVNRVEMLKMLFLMNNVDVSSYEAELFSDTLDGQWYTPYVKAAKARKTIQGYPDGTFKPNQCVNRVEAIKMAVLEFNEGKIPAKYIEYEMPSDINIESNEWWIPYFESAMGSNVIGIEHFINNEVSLNTSGQVAVAKKSYKFCPGCPMSRMEVSEMLYRLKAVHDNDKRQYTKEILPTGLIQCKTEGESLGAVIPENNIQCCEGLKPYIKEGLLGTRGVCVKLDESEARAVAEKAEACTSEGTINSATGLFNANSKTWWFTLDTEKENCSPACVVKDEDSTASINWRCTGSILEDETSTCKTEGESLGAVIPDNDAQCCDGLQPYIEDGMVGTRGVCVKLNEEEARTAANATDTCTKEGALKSTTGLFNENSKTWWFDIDVEKEGCNPACVVKDEDSTIKVNWRCTGLIPSN